MSKAVEDLKDAFAGESQANRKYLAFAEKADREGFPMAARLFRAAVAAETVHAHAHLKVLGGTNPPRKISRKLLRVKATNFKRCILK